VCVNYDNLKFKMQISAFSFVVTKIEKISDKFARKGHRSNSRSFFGGFKVTR